MEQDSKLQREREIAAQEQAQWTINVEEKRERERREYEENRERERREYEEKREVERQERDDFWKR